MPMLAAVGGLFPKGSLVSVTDSNPPGTLEVTTIFPGNCAPTTAAVPVPPTPPAAPGDVTITGIVYRLDKQRLVVTATSTDPTATLFLQAFDSAGKALNATRTPQPMVLAAVVGGPPVPTLDIVGAQFPGKIVVTSSVGGFESVNLTKLPFGNKQPTPANIGIYTVQPDQAAAPAVTVTIRQN